MDEGKQARELESNPDLFERFAGDYKSQFEYFLRLRNNAYKELDFDGYLSIHEIFLRHDMEGGIQGFVETHLARTLKNMALGTSTRGSAYKIDTLSQLESRRCAFAELDVDTPSLQTVVDTIVEQAFDHGWKRSEVKIGALLGDVSGCPTDVVESLALVHATLQLNSGDDWEDVRSEFISATTPAVEEAPPSANDCIQAARDIPYGNSERWALVQTAVHREASRSALVALLRLSAINTVEDARHQGESRPTRGWLGLASLQFEIVAELDESEDAVQRAWRRSYVSFIDGLLQSEGYWVTTREARPSPDFGSAAGAFRRAARELEAVSPKRALTYISKSYRMVAHSTDSHSQKRSIHQEATKELVELMGHVDEAEAQTRGSDLLRVHRLERLKWTLVEQFSSGNYSEVSDAFDDAETLFASCDHRSASIDNVRPLAELAAGYLAEREGEFDEAEFHFDSARISIDEAPLRFRTERIDDRKSVTRFKQALDADDHERARAALDECSREYWLLYAVLDVLAGQEPERVTISGIVNLPALNPGALRILKANLDGDVPDDLVIRSALRI